MRFTSNWLAKREGSNIMVAPPKKKSIQRKPKRFVILHIESEPSRITAILPIDTRSEANSNESWQSKHKRHKSQKAQLRFYMQKITSDNIKLPCHVYFYRLSSRGIDDDNNVSAFKYLRDGLAAMITGDERPGRADNDSRITWHYGQEKCKEQGIKIVITY
jgi:hypothetical protein